MTRIESRVRESWRVRSCAAGLCVGAQIFLFGTGVAVPIALNSAWIASLAALPLAALTAALCRRAQTAPKKDGGFARALYVLLALTLLANAAFALASLLGFVEQTLLPQSPVWWSAAVTLLAVALCAFSGGTGAARLSYALRGLLGVLMPVLAAMGLPFGIPVGLFPILGAGGVPLCVAGVCMLGAASPALLLMLPPPELRRAGPQACACPPPAAKAMLSRVLAGAAVGVLLVFVSCVCSTFESLTGAGVWGQRLRIAANTRPHQGMAETALVVCQAAAMALLAVNMLSGAEQALVRALPAAGRGRAGLGALTLLLAACLLALIVLGFEPALFAAPLLVLPTAVLLIFHGRMGERTP